MLDFSHLPITTINQVFMYQPSSTNNNWQPYVVPRGVSYVSILCVGGGGGSGGGGQSATAGNRTGGGGGGSTSNQNGGVGGNGYEDVYNSSDATVNIFYPNGGGGGGGDMFKATYDPAALNRQVLTTAISIEILDFIDLINKTNTNGNNPTFAGLLPNQTYAVSGMDNFGYSADCLYYVTTVANDNNDVIPAISGFLTAPFSASSNVYRLSVRWNSGAEAPFACEIDSNVFYSITSAGVGELDRTQINGTTSVGLTRNRFYGTWTFTSTYTNAGLNVNINGCDLYNDTNIDVKGDEGVQLSNVILRNSSIYFNSKSIVSTQTIANSTIENANITFADNTSASTSSALQNCTISGLDLTIGVDVTLTGCTFIGKSTGYAISTPDGANYTGKTFVEGEWSDFDTTIDLNAAVTGNQLDLPNLYRFFVGIYNTTNAAQTNYSIDTINIGTESSNTN